MPSKGFAPLIGRDNILIAGVIPNRALGIVHAHLDLALGRSQLLRNSLFHALLLSHELGVSAQQNVSASASHIGGNRHHALAAGLSDDLGFFFVVLGVEY